MPGAEGAAVRGTGSDLTPRYSTTTEAVVFPSMAKEAMAFICVLEAYNSGHGTPFTNTCTPSATVGSRPPEIAGITGVLGPSPDPNIEKMRPGASAAGKKKLAPLLIVDTRGKEI